MTLKQKLHTHGWFILINALIAMIIALRYFSFLPELPTDSLSWSFLITSTITQLSLLTFIIGILAIPFLFLPKMTCNIVQAMIAAIGLSTLFIDTSVFSLYRFHINAVVLELVLSGEVVDFPLVVWAMVISGILVLFALQLGLIHWLGKGPVLMRLKLGRKFSYLIFISLISANALHIWASAYAYQPILSIVRYLPLYYPATANRFMEKHGWLDKEAFNQRKSMIIPLKSDLNYPRKPLTTIAVEKPLNIMIIAIDAWRFDTFTQENTPNLWNMAQTHSAAIFNNNISTGNATRAGIFGLFYGIPSTYWQSFLANRRSPVLMDRLQQLNYELGIFASAQLTSPEFNQTVFVNVPNLRIKSTGERVIERDQSLTNDWLTWDKNRDHSKPAFSFLFYDSVHGFDFPKDYPHKFEPMWSKVNHLELNNDTDPQLYFNLYKTSLHFVDSLIKQVIDRLEATGDIDNTLIIITSDHGEEMNDNKQNYWGHNGNFTNAQVHTPLAIFGPGFNKNRLQRDPNTMTSHQDIVPTLMKNYLGVTNPIEDYSTGQDLLATPSERPWIISAKYSGYAIITDQTILEVRNVGDYSYLNKQNQELNGKKINYQHLQQAIKQMSYFNLADK